MKVIMTFCDSVGPVYKYYSLLNCSATFMPFPNVRSQTQSFKNRRKKICSLITQVICKSNTSNSTYFKKFSIFRIFTIALYLTSIPTVKTTSFHSNFKYSNSTVKTKYGLLRGIIVRTTPVVEAYLGIPYASPPIGSLRYMPPITPSSWKNVRNADRFSPVCPQTVPMPPNGPEALLEVPRARLIHFRRLFPLLSNQSEDCLYLNMYIPKTSSNNYNEHSYLDPESSSGMNIGKSPWIRKSLSALVFIQGESYEWNSGNPYDGSELAAQGNIIVITINFRLGILGFLKTGGKESAQGNFGLMDLVAGLHWLKENLPAFGGDSNQITIMGHGTGAALANILLVSPVSSDLLQRGVLISGSALSPWAIQKYPLYVKRRVAEQTGCHGDLLYDDLAPCLRTKKLSDLLAVKIDYARFLSGFAPFVDGTVIQLNIDDSHMLKLPVGSAIVSSSGIEFANFPKQDLLFGLTSVESYLDLSVQDLVYGLNETHKDRILRTYVRNVFNYHLNEIFAVLKNEYTDWERATRNPFSSRDATLAFLSDGHTASHLIKIGHMHSLRGGRSYFLHFRHKTSEEEYPLRSGSVHGEDIPFWFGLPISPLFPKNYSSEERKLSLAMVQYLSNFVKTGNPNQSTGHLNKENGTEHNFIDEPKINLPESNIARNSSAFLIRSSPASHSSTILNLTSNFTEKTLRKRRSNPKIKRNMDKEKIGKGTYKRKRHPSPESIVYDYRSKTKNIIQDLPHWEVFDSVNQLYLELGHDAEVHSHYRGHKLSMWLNLIPQLHKHSNLKDISMGHHQFVDEDAKFYEGIVRGHLQMKPLDEEREYSVYTGKSTVDNREFTFDTKILDQNDVTTDCIQNITQFPMLTEPTPLYNIPNISDNFFNVLENMDVMRRLSGKQLQSYTTALVATVAVGCFLLILNILIFAAIYHQREKRSKDSRKKEKIEDSEIYMNQASAKNILNQLCSEAPGKELLDEKNVFDQNIAHVIDNDNELIIKENTWVYTTNTIDLLDMEHSRSGMNENKSTAFASMENNYMSLENAFSAQTLKMPYQPINGFSESKQEIVIQGEKIPMPPPPPKSISQGGILRVTGSNHVSSSNKKRVHIQEISV